MREASMSAGILPVQQVAVQGEKWPLASSMQEALFAFYGNTRGARLEEDAATWERLRSLTGSAHMLQLNSLSIGMSKGNMVMAMCDTDFVSLGKSNPRAMCRFVETLHGLHSTTQSIGIEAAFYDLPGKESYMNLSDAEKEKLREALPSIAEGLRAAMSGENAGFLQENERKAALDCGKKLWVMLGHPEQSNDAITWLKDNREVPMPESGVDAWNISHYSAPQPASLPR